jgi:hypothetical protein
VTPTPRRRGRDRVDDAAFEGEGTRFEEVAAPTPGEAAAALPAEPTWLSEAPDMADPEAGKDPAAKAAQE